MLHKTLYNLYHPEHRYRTACVGDLDERWRMFALLFDSAWETESLVKCKKSRKVVLRHVVNGKAFYVKIYSRRHAKGIQHNLLRSSSLALFPNKAVKHMKLAGVLKNIGIEVVEPIMAIERRYGLVRQESMLVTPEYQEPALAHCLRNDEKWEVYLPALEKMIRDIAKMHDAGYIHRDPHFGNVLVTEDLNVLWLDFGTIKRFRLNKKKTYRDLRKLREKSVKMLAGRVDDPDEFAKDLLERNYPHHDRLHAAIE